MSKRIIGLIVACVLALFGGASVTVPAAAAPQSSAAAKAAKTKAAKAKTAKAKAAKARAAEAKAAAQAKAKAAARARAKAKAAAAARARYVAEAGPRATAAAKAARGARAQALTKAKAAVVARSTALAAARTAATAQAKAVAVAKTKAKSKVKAKAKAAAKAAVKAKNRAAAKAKRAAAAASKANAAAAARTQAAAKARLDYVALAGPRAEAAAKAARAARARAKAAAAVATRARSKARTAAKAAAKARSKVTKIAKTKTKSKAKARALASAKAKAVAGAAAAARRSAQAKARARSTKAAAGAARARARSAEALADKAKKAAGRNPSWAPKDSLIFNNPRGSKRRKRAIINQINKAIDASPAGSQIRMAQYLFDIKNLSQKLIDAHRRGVSVQILIDDGETNRHIRRVRRALGKDKSARSFVATCDHSCMSSGFSVIHAKFYLFSTPGKARHVSMISSANPYTGNTYRSWNNIHTIVGDKLIYDSLSKYFTDMLADKDDLNYYRVTTSGKNTIYLYPRAARKAEEITLLNVLNHTSCKTTAKGYGSGGRTLIRVANWGWTSTRMDVAKRLWQLHNGGCKVQVMVNKGRISRSILYTLLKRSKKYGKMPVYDAWYDKNNNNVAGLYVHHKMVTINGLLSGKNVKITWTGSQNFTRAGTLANNDIVLRVVDPAVLAAYNDNFAFIRSRYTHRLRSVPPVTRRPDKD